jgi:hypothetical protein
MAFGYLQVFLILLETNLKVRFQAEDSLFNILVLIRFPPEIRLAGIPNCLQSCILHLDFSRFSGISHPTGNRSDIKRL